MYQALPVSAEGRSLYLPERSVANGVMTFGSVPSLPQALEELVPRFAAVVDGGPGDRAGAGELSVDRQRVELTGVPETMLWTLNNRAAVARRPQ